MAVLSDARFDFSDAYIISTGCAGSAMETTETTRNFMSAAFDGAEWAVRDPKVLRGTMVTADNYWKGAYDHANALKMIRMYQCSDPYVTTEMEDIAVCAAAKRMGLLDRVIVLRTSVNMDVFMLGNTPEKLWNPDYDWEADLATNENIEAADIFATAMKNNFAAGSAVIDAILAGSF